jgi:hypothetical protein
MNGMNTQVAKSAYPRNDRHLGGAAEASADGWPTSARSNNNVLRKLSEILKQAKVAGFRGFC